MSMGLTGALILAALAIAGVAYVRLAPDDVAAWHQLPAAMQAGDKRGGALRKIAASPGALSQLDRIARASARTQVLAGSAEEGMITYITRTRGIGFPDYTTISEQNAQIIIYGRLRYGLSDLGVNARRIDGWLALLGQGRG